MVGAGKMYLGVQMETESRYIAVGSFVFILMLGFMAFTIWMSKIDWYENYIYEIYFPGSISGLREREVVTYNGVPIGSVKEIDIDPEKINLIRVLVGIDNRALIRESTFATLETKGLTGITTIQMHGSEQTSPILRAKKGEVYPIIRSKSSNFQELFEETPKILQKLVVLIDRITPVFNDENLKALNLSIKNISTFTSALGASSKDVENLFVQAPKTLKSIDEAMGGFKTSVDKSGQNLDETLNQVKGLIEENRPYIKNFTSGGLYEATQSMLELRNLIKNLTRFLEKLKSGPAKSLFESDPEGYVLEEEK